MLFIPSSAHFRTCFLECFDYPMFKHIFSGIKPVQSDRDPYGGGHVPLRMNSVIETVNTHS